MTENNQLIETILLLLIVGLVLNKFLENHISEIKIAIIIIISSCIILGVLVYIIKRIIENRKTKEASGNDRYCFDEERLPESLDDCKTKKEEIKNEEIIEPKKLVKSDNTMLTQKPKVGVSIGIDEFKGFYKYKNLNSFEVKYLLSKKYVLVKKRSVSENKVEKFLLKPRFNESLNHCFVVYDIAEFLESKGIKVTKFTTKKPDIVFEIINKSFAIEVETGNKINKDKRVVLEKVKQLKKDYDYWFFVVTNRNFVKKYKKLGKTIDVRYLSKRLRKIIKYRH